MKIRTFKALLLSVALLGAPSVFAKQPKSAEFKVENGLFVYEKIEAVDLSKREIVSHAAAFLAEHFKSSRSIIELRDDELGKIVGDIIVKNPKAKMLSAFPAIRTRIIIDAKDGRYRLQATNIVGVDGNGTVTSWGIEGANQYRIEPAALEALNAFSSALNSYINNAQSSGNW
ncbi:DUF4468 domain-containing protein [Lysobacter brunescens]|uniref:DUF4468 domain-containing protein n=1 Tax=Lysobacter brunescens TaxID=262323 RepID=A0ABW2YKM5_9GAMM